MYLVYMRRTRKYKTRRRRGGNKSCRQNEQDWQQHWNPETSKRGAIPMKVKQECCTKFDKNTRYFGAWNIMKGARYPQINGMNHECDDYIPNTSFGTQEYSTHMPATALTKKNDPFFNIPIAKTQHAQRFTETGDSLAQEVTSSNAPYAEVKPIVPLTPTQEAEQRQLQNFLYR